MDSRFRSMFSSLGQLPSSTGPYNPGNPGQPTLPEMQNPNPEQPPMQEGNGVEDRAYKQFLDLVNNFPVRKEPSTLRKIGASVAALSGKPDTVENALYPGYDREVNDWENKAKVSGNLAQIEGSRNSAAIRDDYNRLTNEWRLVESKRKGEADEKRGEQGDRRLDQRDEELDIKRGQLDLRKEANEGAQGIRVNQRTGKTYLWYKDGRTKELDQNDLSFEHRQKLAQAGKIELLDLQNAFTRERDETKHEYTLDEIAERLSKKGENTSDTQLKQRKLNRAGEWARTHPQASSWIEVDPDTGFMELKPTGIWRDRAKDADLIKDFNTYIDEKEVETKVPGAIPGNNTGSVKPGSRFPSKNPAAPAQKMKDADIRAEAIKQLQGKAPVTEPNIAEAIKQLRAQGK